MSSALDPTRVLVIAIGIDDYKHARMRLSGAAAYARRVAEWALARGVPGTNVWLGCSPAVSAVGDEHEIRVFEPSRAGIEDVLFEASTFGADLLVFYWCGHGVLHERRRAVFTSDVHEGSMRVHNIDIVQRYLASDTVAHLKDQVLVIDACANFYDSLNVPDSVINSVALNIGSDRSVNQFTLYSAGQGQVAQFDKVDHSTEFSETVLGWFEDQQGFPVDPSSLTRRVKSRFAELREHRRFRQRPTTCIITCANGEDENWEFRSGIPVAGSVFRDIEQMGLTVAHTRRATRAVTEMAALTSELDMRGALLATLEHLPDLDDLDVHALVTKVLSSARGEQLFKILESRITTDTERFALLEIKASWQRQRVITEVEEVFNPVTTRQIGEAFWRSGAGTDGADGAPVELGEALDRVAELGSGTDGFRPLHRFVAALEQATGSRVDDPWFGLSGNRLQALRTDAAAHADRHSRVVIEIPNGTDDFERFEWPSMVGCHRYVPGLESPWRPIEWRDCAPSLAGVRTVVNELVTGTEQHCALGFILPRVAFDAMPEAWDFETIVDSATPHWMYRPTVLHCAERRILYSVNENWRRKMEAIATRVEHHGPDLTWIPHSAPGAVRTWVRDSHATCLGMEFVPDKLGGELRHDPLMAAINAGAPFIVWAAHQGEDWADVKQLLRQLVEQGPFGEVPTRVHRWRETRSHDASNHVRLLWDDPSVLPPAPMLRGMP